MAGKTVADAVSHYGASTKSKLASVAISGAPEDQLRGPLETLIRELAELGGLPAASVQLIGETTLSDIKTRPDFAVTVSKALVGFIEVKAPGKGADPRRFDNEHDKDQWDKLKSLPNLMYTDGNAFSLWRDGKLDGEIVRLEGNVESSGGKLAAPATLLPLISDFLRWAPIPPKTAKQLAEVSARLCRLLRDEVIEQMALSSSALTGLAQDWRKLLFPQADDAQFADGYAQAVTFGLLVARARDISLAHGTEEAAQELRKSNSLIGTALRLLTEDSSNQKALETSLKTLTRVLEEVNWHTISKDKPEAWLYFYEDFLEVYDNTLRKRTGSYYTPPEVVSAMVNLVDEALRGPLFERAAGFAAPDVVVADPAVGTGTFLLGVLRRIASTVAKDQGEGAVRGAIEAAAKRIIGFEIQFGPFAVAQLRLIAELQALMNKPPLPELRLFITDTLGNPFIEEERLGQTYEPIAVSRRAANKVKKEERITVVIGNPPYKNQAGGMGGWIENGSAGRPAPLSRWTPPPEWGVGAHAHHLKNLYVYFWRWATLKVFGSGWKDATGQPDEDRYGVVCFITVAGFLNGPGFQKMREDLRRDSSEIYVIDCSPEGHQPDVPTRIFEGVQQPVCIVLTARAPNKDRDVPARLRYVTLPKGKRENKFDALAKLSIHNSDWEDGAIGWREPFLPEQSGAWATFPSLIEFFAWSSPGVKTHRTWVIAPDAQSLEKRWDALRIEGDTEKKDQLFHPDRDRYLSKVVKIDLGLHHVRPITVAQDQGLVVTPIRYAFRSFDRQWIVPDHRLLSMARSDLWAGESPKQVYLTCLEAHSPENGPAITFTNLIPDNDHYKGSFGGRILPLWRDNSATQPNIKPALLAHLANIYARPVKAEDVMAYLAAVMAHPAFTARFKADLVRPGLHVPLTADAKLFAEAVALGSEVIWLHCYGERFADPSTGRPKQAPRLSKESAPTIPKAGAIPGAPEPLPDSMDYDPATRRLKIGKGYVENVTPEMWAYEVSGKQVLWHWFSYRRGDRSRPIIGDRRPPSPLDKVQPDHWLPEYTSDLLNLLNVLGRLIALEPKQADLLERICAGRLRTAEELRDVGALADVGEKPTLAKGKSKSNV
ncbi:MAG: N-6 DNA methylase [Deltaproteobacteria bacterium]|nr:N-6 DNA methylase [Deltaproteobacteria bacterium]